MTLRVTRLLAVAILATAAVLVADEPRCGATARECEQQIRQMLARSRYLGVQVVQLKPGIVIKSVVPNSPAEKAGLEDGDRLIAVNGRAMTNATVRDFKQVIAEAPGRLWIIVQHRGAFKKIEVTLRPYSKEQLDKIVNAHLQQSHTTATEAP